jgi:hypothetical protein
MPHLAYHYVARPANTCVGPTSANLVHLPDPITPGWPQLYAAQASIGVYPAGWAALEMTWRLSSLRLSSTPAILSPSPVIQQADPTEKGQLSYHIGTAAGIATGLFALAPGMGARFFPMFFTRAVTNGAGFNFANLQRPDVLFFSVTLPGAGGPPAPVVNNIVVWECKGHANNAGQATLVPALNQALALTAMTQLPGGGALAAPMAPVSYVASQVDVFFGNYRLQIIDPDKPGKNAQSIPMKSMNDFLKTFYDPFVEIVAGAEKTRVKTFGGRKFITVEILPKIYFGLDQKIFKCVQQNAINMSIEIGSILKDGYKNAGTNSYWVMEFGLIIDLEKGWDTP